LCTRTKSAIVDCPVNGACLCFPDILKRDEVLPSTKVTRKPSLEVATTTLATLFRPVTVNFNLRMTLTFELDLDSIKVNQQAKHLGQRPFSSKIITQTHRQTHSADRLLYGDY